jgi:hypothetical protein
LDSAGIRRVQRRIPANMNPFYYYGRVIISVDTLKRDQQYQNFLRDSHWDAIVIDECQHVAERGKGRSRSLRSRLAKLLAQRCDALIMASATPHDGRADSYASLIRLLEPTAIADVDRFTAEDVRDYYVRRFKCDVAHEVGSAFPERVVTPVHVEASPEENAVFEALAAARFKTVGRSKDGELFRILLVKSFLSSPQALIATVEERLKSRRLKQAKDDDSDAAHDREVLRSLKRAAQAVGKKSGWTKFDRLVALLCDVGIGQASTHDRVVLFSERIDTLEALREALPKAVGASADQFEIFHGSLKDGDQQQLVGEFRRKDSPVRVLLASDAASEGINLHFFCHRLIHFDIPWSLITLEQRNGRIDRYGQERTPEITALLARPANRKLRGDLRVLDRLVEKEDAVHHNLGDVRWLMRLHDAQREEERIVEGVAKGEPAESIIPEEPQVDDFMTTLLAATRDEAKAEDTTATVEPTRLYPDNLAYFKEAFAELRSHDRGMPAPEWHDHDEVRGCTLTAPADLQYRFSYLPAELVADDSWQFKLTTNTALVQQALAEARERSREWPEWQYLWEQHPIAEWLNDRVVAHFRRNEAPVVRVAKGLGGRGVAYVVQGVLSNRRSQPARVEWLAVVMNGPGEPVIRPLPEVMAESGLAGRLNNADDVKTVRALERRLGEAVFAAKEHMRAVREDRKRALRPDLAAAERALKKWKREREAQLARQEERARARSPQGPTNGAARRLADEREAIEATYRGRLEFVRDTLATADEPYLRLVMVLVGPEWKDAGKGGRQ